MSEQFLVLCGQIVGNMQAGFEVVYDWDGETHADRKQAIASGLKSRGSDDFSIGVIRDGRLASLDWMDEPKDEEPDTLRDIQDQIGWEDPRNTFAVQQEADALQQGGDETDFEWVRRLRAHFTDATAIAEAAARGKRQGLEEAGDWKRVAESAGVCMTCALGAPDISVGCTDCLNTGFAHGAPQGYVSEGFHEEEIAKLKRQLENRQGTIDVLEEVIAKKERPCARKNDDGSWDLSGPCLTCGAADEHICGRGARGYIANPTARAEGRRQGLEEAAAYFVAQISTAYGYHRLPADEVAQHLRSLATGPAETQKPETGESTR